MALRIGENPGEGYEIRAGQLYCTLCLCNIGSGKHAEGKKHIKLKTKARQDCKSEAHLKAVIHTWAAKFAEENDGTTATGTARIPEAVQVFRAQTVKQFLLAGMPLAQISGSFRHWLERPADMPLMHRALSSGDSLSHAAQN